jgi:LuxR family transcriptional regulator, maltose regulon positive regulatory protein
MTARAASQLARAGRPAVPASAPILAAKITAPGVPDWVVPRPRITKLIARGRRWHPLTVITAPAGAGKTMALALWAAAGPGPVAWVGLDEFDNQPGSFWAHVAAALRRAGGAVPEPPPAGRGPDAGRVFVLGLAAALAVQDPPLTLVLDDLHLLTDPQVLGGLDYVLRNTGAGLRLVVSARMDPLPLHRYRLAGQLTEIGASDLAFTSAEAGQLLARHGVTLTAGSIESLTRRTEGWAAGLRLAAISMRTHPDPDQFITELITQDSALTGYLVAEVLNPQPPAVRDVLLNTSILEQVSGGAARELTGNTQAAGILTAVARANGFVQRSGSERYRYHPLFAEVLRLKLNGEHPDRTVPLHRRAARWYERNGQLTDAVRHAAQAGDWPLAASMVIDGLAIGKVIEPQGSPSLADVFRSMPHRDAWDEPQPYLVCAAVALSAGAPGTSAAALDAAEGLLERLPAGQEAESRLAAALIGLAASRRAGDLAAAAAAAARAQVLVSMISPATLARHPGIKAQVLSGRGAAELWSGHLDQAACILESAVTATAEDVRAECLGYLALAEALRGRMRRAATAAAQAAAALTAGQPQPPVPRPIPAALVALAWVHLERYELGEVRSRLKEADAVLSGTQDKLTGAVAWLVAAGEGLAGGRAAAAAQIIGRVRSGWSVPAWLDHRLSDVESRAYVASGDIQAALAVAGRASSGTSPEAAVTLARAWAAAGDGQNAGRVLAPALAALDGAPDRVRLNAWLVDARLHYDRGDHARGRRSLASALRLAEREQLRLPFALERSWIGRALRCDPELARAHRDLLAPALGRDQLPAPQDAPERAAILVVEPLTAREREVLRHVACMLSTAEVASEMHISANTVKTHLQHICRKLAATGRGQAVRRARQLELI